MRLLEKAKSYQPRRVITKTPISQSEEVELLLAYLNGRVSASQVVFALGKSRGNHSSTIALLCRTVRSKGGLNVFTDGVNAPFTHKKKGGTNRTCGICGKGFRSPYPTKTCGRPACVSKIRSDRMKKFHLEHPGLLSAAKKVAEILRREGSTTIASLPPVSSQSDGS